MRGLLSLAIKDGEILRDSWWHVLDCISKIDSMRVFGLGEVADSEIFNSSRVQSSNDLKMKNCAIIAD